MNGQTVQHEMQAKDNDAPHTTDVLIVGAGPVGLTMACELLRHGVRCRIIDQTAEPTRTSRALAIQPGTLEVFNNMGVVDRFLAAGQRASAPSIYDGSENGKGLVLVTFQHIKDSPYTFLLILPQSMTESLLLKRLAELGGVVERSHELLAIQQDGDAIIASVKVTGADAGGEEQIRARWLIGCDGAHSVVRRIEKIPFEGRTAPDEFLLGDVDLDWDKTRETTHGWLTRDGLFAVFPLPGGQWRLFATLREGKGQQVPQASVDEFQRLLVQYTGDRKTKISNPTWMSNFRISYRVASVYRKGHVFLAGDAAHIHSPFGGQGMNIGIQDAYNLAWKLALVLQGKGQESLLDTYQQERKPIARLALQGTETSTTILTTRNPVLLWLRDHIIIPFVHTNTIQQYLAQQASGLALNYRHSALSRSYRHDSLNVGEWRAWLKAPHAGDRMKPGAYLSYPAHEEMKLTQLLHGTESHLLLFAGLASTEADEKYIRLTELASRIEALTANSIKAHLVIIEREKPAHLAWNGSILLDPQGKLHTLYGAHKAALYLIRPDSYIGFRSQPIAEEQLIGYLGKVLLLASAPISSKI